MLAQILNLSSGSISIADIGAAFFGQPPPYQPLLDEGFGQLFAFEPDEREVDPMRANLPPSAKILPFAVGDGREHKLYIGPKGLGMSSLLEPDPQSLGFFNLFPEWGKVVDTLPVSTRRLDDIDELPPIDFLKMDVQGSELSILQNGNAKLSQCVAVQTEISFITLYKNQPTFGAIDLEMRRQGFIPHRFTDMKCWSIAPTIRNNEPRWPFNQLLEADIVYIRDIIHPDDIESCQIAKLAVIAHSVYQSPDLAVRCILELEARQYIADGSRIRYLEYLATAR